MNFNKLKVFEAFAGIGATSRALKKANIDIELVGYSEIDKYASKAFSLIHNVEESLNYGDITKIDIDNLPNFDLLAAGSPCTDFSSQGKRKGLVFECNDCNSKFNPIDIDIEKRNICPVCGNENLDMTASSLIFKALEIIYKKKPKYVMFENVKGFVMGKFKEDFDDIKSELNSYGYNVYWKLMNAKDYGLPQNRERVIVIAIRKDVDNISFKYPEPMKLNLHIVDILDKKIDDKFFLTEKSLERYKDKEVNVISSIREPKIKYYIKDIFKKAVLDPYGISTTVMESHGDAIRIFDTNYNKIRKITPFEAFKLMGFEERDVLILKENGISDSQIMKMAGNSIAVNKLIYTFDKLFNQ